MNRIPSIILTLILLSSICSCIREKQENRELEYALQFAADNRKELEHVLEYYAHDSLKLEAAKFLIRNMPCHYSYVDTIMPKRYAQATDSVVFSMRAEIDFNVIRDAIDSVARALGLDTLRKEFDSRMITADFLIKNIDEAFRDWKNGKWARHIDFAIFCECILPYKTEELQPLDDWRTRLKSFYTGKLYELNYCDQLRYSPLAATKILNKNLTDSLHPTTGLSVQHTYMPLENRAKIPFGQCNDYVRMTTSILRSHGIPTYEEFTPQWAGRSLGHAWNTIISSDGRKISFAGITEQVDGLHKAEERMAKVYRRTFAINKELQALNQTDKYIPEVFKDIFIKDVTKEHISCHDVVIKVNGMNGEPIYLLTFDNHNWVPVAYCRVHKGKAQFKDMGLNIVYLAASYNDNGIIKPLSDPFILHYDGHTENIVPNLRARRDMTLKRKYPVMEYSYEYIPRLQDGEFQASNRADFRTYQTVYTIKEGCSEGVEINISDSIPPYRFWRYISHRYASFCSMAEIYFHPNNDTVKLQGKIIGTDGSWGNDSLHTKEKVFDNDILTSYDAPQGEGCWVGMDFGKPIKIDHIIYYGRGDGNSIEISDTYALYYWHNNDWMCIGKKHARHPYVTFHNVPTEGLYLLRDLTKGHDERIFTFSSGKQTWW